MRSNWRGYRCRITKKLKDISKGPDASRYFRLMKPANVHNIDEWMQFVKYRLSTEFEVR